MQFSLGRAIGFLFLTSTLLLIPIKLEEYLKENNIPEVTDFLLTKDKLSRDDYAKKEKLAMQAKINWN